MARLPRFFVPGYPLHVIQRGNNREALFGDEADYRAYAEWFRDAADRHGCAVHAYVLMTNHVHVLVTPEQPDSLPKTFQSLGRRCVQYVNALYGRTGTLEGIGVRSCTTTQEETSTFNLRKNLA